jgi:hypothetical protein
MFQSYLSENWYRKQSYVLLEYSYAIEIFVPNWIVDKVG